MNDIRDMEKQAAVELSQHHGAKVESLLRERAQLMREAQDLRAEVDRLAGLLNTPHTGNFFDSVQLEAGHQVLRWGTEHDHHNEPTDWFWLIGFLAGKAVSIPEKRKHHIISSAAVLLNWYRRETGDEHTFQPGASITEA